MTLEQDLELLHKKLDELLEMERRREQDSFDRATLERSMVFIESEPSELREANAALVF
jgi:hypothetical protein